MGLRSAAVRSFARHGGICQATHLLIILRPIGWWAIKQRIAEFIEKYETRLEVAFFLGGFLFDVLLLSDPDDLFGIIQQVVYLVAIGRLIHYEILFRLHRFRPGRWMRKVWGYRNLALHFCFGSLLNLYSLFYIKSASIFSSAVFLVIMIGIILGNELPIVKQSKVGFKVGLYAICVFSFFSILFPIAVGFVGWIPFLASVAATILVFYGHFKRLLKRELRQSVALKAMVGPAVSVMVVFVTFYTFGWIPPVPLSVREQGVYHAIEKRDGKVFLSYEKAWWKVWQKSDSPFRYLPGEKLYFYAQVYSPTRISDQVIIHFMTKERGSWISADRIPLTIHGGREEGFRGYAFKTNYTPGEWQIRLETSSGIEISRHYVDVEPMDQVRQTSSPREFTVLER